jgi:hypothetical protein
VETKKQSYLASKGDQNTKFFHQYVNHRRNRKAIWDIKDEDDNLHSRQEALIT